MKFEKNDVFDSSVSHVSVLEVNHKNPYLGSAHQEPDFAFGCFNFGFPLSSSSSSSSDSSLSELFFRFPCDFNLVVVLMIVIGFCIEMVESVPVSVFYEPIIVDHLKLLKQKLIAREKKC